HPDEYAVAVSTNCYSETDNILIEADADCNHELFIPNVFSPNGDNINDEWTIHFTDPNITSVECRVFGRWGDLMFATKSNPIYGMAGLRIRM
ncbi:MAG TPA: gliding motility-associated C-terminal domain-containing protein, partial [Saprospiraceae bacterium]|nr:gliding motility-associated C-terminal domain-containing protein [Saprospiraceae bacterium]